MKATIFAKRRMTSEGKVFYTYLTTLTRKDGSEVIASVKFRDACGVPKPESCPMNIIFDKSAANLSKHTFVKESTGDVCEGYTLWVTDWMEGEPYVDNSLDDYC